MPKKVSIVIINYNTFDITCECIKRVIDFTTSIDYEIILADNGSTECSADFFLKKFPFLKLIKNEDNVGFARANNQGIRIADAEIVLLLNSDVFVENDAIGKSVLDFMQSDYVAAGIQLLNSDRTPQISGNYFMRGGLNYLLPLPYMGYFVKLLADLLGIKKTNIPNATSVMEVDWVNGAYLMVKKNAVQKAGLMDEDFFLYSEEIEWCSRLRKYGKICIYGQYNAIHLQGASSVNSFDSQSKGYKNLFDKKGLQIIVSTFVRIRKQFGVTWFLFMLLMYIIEVPIMFAGVLISFLLQLKERYTLKQFIGYTHNIFKLISLSLIIVRNNPYFYKML